MTKFQDLIKYLKENILFHENHANVVTQKFEALVGLRSV